MSINKVILAGAVLLGLSTGATQAAVYADSATSQDVTFFGSGILTGAPDGGGAFIGTTFDPPAVLGSITWGFSSLLYDGAGADIRLYEIASSENETFDVALSLDGVGFTSIGIFNALQTVIDVNGLFAGYFAFIRVSNTSRLVSADFDTAEGLNVAPVPLPAALPLLAAGLGAMGVMGWRRKRRTA